MPPGWRKKKLDEKINKDWKKFTGMTDVNAKYRYVQLCRSLKTYGITFFNCKVLPPLQSFGCSLFSSINQRTARSPRILHWELPETPSSLWIRKRKKFSRRHPLHIFVDGPLLLLHSRSTLVTMKMNTWS